MTLLLAVAVLCPILLIGLLMLLDDVRDDVRSVYSEQQVRRRRKRELHLIELEFPGVVELFTILVSAGQSPSAALLRISEVSSAVACLRHDQ